MKPDLLGLENSAFLQVRAETTDCLEGIEVNKRNARYRQLPDKYSIELKISERAAKTFSLLAISAVRAALLDPSLVSLRQEHILTDVVRFMKTKCIRLMCSIKSWRVSLAYLGATLLCVHGYLSSNLEVLELC